MSELAPREPPLRGPLASTGGAANLWVTWRKGVAEASSDARNRCDLLSVRSREPSPACAAPTQPCESTCSQPASPVNPPREEEGEGQVLIGFAGSSKFNWGPRRDAHRS
jgi:hypothetical protein